MRCYAMPGAIQAGGFAPCNTPPRPAAKSPPLPPVPRPGLPGSCCLSPPSCCQRPVTRLLAGAAPGAHLVHAMHWFERLLIFF